MLPLLYELVLGVVAELVGGLLLMFFRKWLDKKNKR